MSEAAVRTESLSKTYRSGLINRERVHALNDVSLTVEAGAVFGLLGPNGAGKTTLMKILMGIVSPTQGRARLFGEPIQHPDARQRIGFLPEKHRFPDFLTAQQMLNLYGRLSGVSTEEREARIPELLERVGMAEWKDTRIKKFSKGMMQRVGLAQALLNDPDLVFLDEPTDGVDPVGRREIRDLLVWLRNQGKTVFLNSHLLSEVEQVCSRIAILHKGELARQGTIDELTSADHIYDIQATRLPDSLLDDLDEAIRLADEPETGIDNVMRYRALVDTRSDLNALLDRLRSEGIELEAVQPVRRTLEDYFIDVVGQSTRPDDMQDE